MTRHTFTGGAFIVAFAAALAMGGCSPAPDGFVGSAATSAAATTGSMPATAAADASPGVIYGRIAAVDGATYEGRLRWGGDQEAFWNDHFDGTKVRNPWAGYFPQKASPLEIFGFEIGNREGRISLSRPFMTRFGDIARVEAHFADVRVTLKSGTVVDLNRFEAGDIDDGVRVWDRRRGVVDLDSRVIRSIEFLSASTSSVAAPRRLHGTVRTPDGDFTGFVEWDGREGLGTDTLDGRSGGVEVHLRYDTIRSIARRSRDSVQVVLRDGREHVLSNSREVDHSNRGIYVDDQRYGRVRISWGAFEQVSFTPAGSGGPGYGDFPPGRALAGSVTTTDGRRFTGRLVYDIDESETTDTLDGSRQGVDYSIPFSDITAILPNGREGSGATYPAVRLRSGEEVELERSGDLADGNGGLLIFVAGRARPEFVPWTAVERLTLDPLN